MSERLGIVVNACNPSIRGAELGRLWVYKQTKVYGRMFTSQFSVRDYSVAFWYSVEPIPWILVLNQGTQAIQTWELHWGQAWPNPAESLYLALPTLPPPPSSTDSLQTCGHSLPCSAQSSWGASLCYIQREGQRTCLTFSPGAGSCWLLLEQASHSGLPWPLLLKT
jgi:hypothetical protein